MEHERRTKVVVIIALLVAVLGLSVGFAAYSKTLNIQNAQATVTGNEGNFDVVFSTASASASTGSLTGSGTGGSGTATLNATTITGLTANFKGAGNIVYSFNVYNKGKLTAYLKAVNIGTKTCTAGSNATQSLVEKACGDISVTVRVGETDYNSASTVAKDKTGLAQGKNAVVTVTINNTGTNAVDGDFTAKYNTIALVYGTQPAT